VSQYSGYSNGFNAGFWLIGVTNAGNKYNEQWNFDGFSNYGLTYFENGPGISIIPSDYTPKFGVIWEGYRYGITLCLFKHNCFLKNATVLLYQYETKNSV
jgi:hypothetical protein